MDDRKKCMVCLEEMETDQEYLPCAHSFHGNCIIPWLQERDTCPICKIPVYIDTPDQLDRYNHDRILSEERDVMERAFFQRLSAGDNPPGNPDPVDIEDPDPNIFTVLSSVINAGANITAQLNPQQQASHSTNTLMALVGLFDTLSRGGHVDHDRPDNHSEPPDESSSSDNHSEPPDESSSDNHSET